MDLDDANTRFTEIERTWNTTVGQDRVDIRNELVTLRASLVGHVGSQAAAARWLGRRIDRVVRHLDATPA